jgi:hypothetical protein
MSEKVAFFKDNIFVEHKIRNNSSEKTAFNFTAIASEPGVKFSVCGRM